MQTALRLADVNGLVNCFEFQRQASGAGVTQLDPDT